MASKAAYFYDKVKEKYGVSFKEVCKKLNFSSKESLKRLCKVAAKKDTLERVKDMIRVDSE